MRAAVVRWFDESFGICARACRMAQTGGGAVEAGCAQPQTELEFRIVWAVSAQNGTLWCAVVMGAFTKSIRMI